MNVSFTVASSTADYVSSSSLFLPSAATIDGRVSGGVNSQKLLGCSMAVTECSIAMHLYMIGCPLLLLVGTVGNTLSFIVLTATRQLRHSAFGMYLSTLAVFDTLTLWITLPRHFVKWLWLMDIRETSEWSCRVFRFLQFSLMNTSAWLLVAVTAERCLSIYFPTKVRYYNGLNRTRIIISALCAVHFLWNVHIFWTLGPQRDKEGKIVKFCGYPDDASAFYWRHVHNWIDMAKLSLLPFALMLVMNASIVVSMRRRANDCSHGKGLLNEANSGGGAAASGNVCGGGGVNAAAQRARAASSKTVMLLPVSIFFLVATAPTFIETAVRTATADGGGAKSERAQALLVLVDCLSTMLLYSNNAFNFILYCLSGATFRKLCAAKLRSACSRRRDEIDAAEEYTLDSTAHGGGSSSAAALHCRATLPPLANSVLSKYRPLTARLQPSTRTAPLDPRPSRKTAAAASEAMTLLAPSPRPPLDASAHAYS